MLTVSLQRARARRLDALITELLANDKDVSEFRELFRIATDPSTGDAERRT